jgi:hypothetical protein
MALRPTCPVCPIRAQCPWPGKTAGVAGPGRPVGPGRAGASARRRKARKAPSP